MRVVGGGSGGVGVVVEVVGGGMCGNFDIVLVDGGVVDGGGVDGGGVGVVGGGMCGNFDIVLGPCARLW